MKEKNNTLYYGFMLYAAIATVLSAYYTFSFTKWLMGGAVAWMAILLLDFGFWLLDLVLPHVKNEEQRNTVWTMKGILLVFMLVTSIGEGMRHAIDHGVIASIGGTTNINNFSGLSVLVVAFIGSVGIIGYSVFRYYDPETEKRMEEIQARAEIETRRKEYRNAATKQIAAQTARKQAAFDMRRSLEREAVYTAAEIDAIMNELDFSGLIPESETEVPKPAEKPKKASFLPSVFRNKG